MSDAAIQVLLVEDNAADAALLRRELTESPFGPFSITHVRRLSKALHHLQQRRYEAVLLDLGLPDGQGIKSLREMQKVKPRGVPVVVVTGRVEESLRAIALQEGADDYFIKGVSTENLLARAVRQIVEHRLVIEAVMTPGQRLDLAVDAGLGIFEWDVQSDQIKWSHNHAALFGLAPDQFGGTYDDFKRCVHPEDRLRITEKIDRAMEIGQQYRQEYRVVWPDGSEHWIAERGRLLIDCRCQPLRMIGTVVDISQRKAAEESARSRDAEAAHQSRLIAMGQMASGLAHELRQPLAAILNYANACLARIDCPKEPPESAREAIQGVLSEARRAGAIISGMRSFVSKQRPTYVGLDLNQIVRQSVDMMGFELRRQHVNPRLLLAGGLPQVLGDAVQIEQVLVNLITNALEAIGQRVSPRHGLTIKTALHDAGQSVQVSVIDNGCGISPDKMGRLFEPFFTTKPGGMGMGLNLCRSIIESQGGRLTATRNAERGMRFSFTVPAAG